MHQCHCEESLLGRDDEAILSKMGEIAAAPRCAPGGLAMATWIQPVRRMLQQVTAPSALASSETSTVTMRTPARSSCAAVKGKASG